MPIALRCGKMDSCRVFDPDQRVRQFVAPRYCSRPIRRTTCYCASLASKKPISAPLPLLSESFMRIFNPLVTAILLVTQSASVQAADLNGAWSVDASACGQIFTRENNVLAFKKDADLHAGGLIVRGRQVTGTFEKCTVRSLRDDGPTMRLIASCSDGVSISDVTFDVTFSGENNITLSSKAPVPVQMPYVRCPM